uniref:SUMO-activating enzyme subunit 1 n=1 Tax=Petromyzon marinus TaxID=7757 RepID=S4RRW2_PETMA
LAATMVENETAISEEEAAQYDRQIRLWGLEAQKRLRASKLLIVGMKGLGAEVAKNLILAGVKSVTFLDNNKATEESTRAQFLVPQSRLGENLAEASLERAQNLNPMVDVRTDKSDIASKTEEFFTQFDSICLTGCPQDVMIKINRICHERNIKFFAGDVFGYHGYMFADLGIHDYVEEKPKKVEVEGAEDGPAAKKRKVISSESTMVKKTVEFCTLVEALDADWTTDQAKKIIKKTPAGYFLTKVLLRFRTEQGRDPAPQTQTEDTRHDSRRIRELGGDIFPHDFYSSCFSELSPICAVVGGVLGQEIVKALSGRDEPSNNFFFFDGLAGNGMVDCIGKE